MVVSFRVFKKASPNNKVTIYLGRRDFIDHVTESDPIDGVLLIDKEYLQGRQVHCRLKCLGGTDFWLETKVIIKISRIPC